jgi:hypothetical protein
LLSPAEAKQVATIAYQRNLLACKTGDGYCDHSLLSPRDSREVADVRHQRNNLACEADDETCERSGLSVTEAKQNSVGSAALRR